MSSGFLDHDVHNHEDGMLLYQFSPNLVLYLSTLWFGWTVSQCIDCDPGLAYLAYALTRYVEWVVTHSCNMVLHTTIYTILRMAWCFFSSIQIWIHSLGTLWLGCTRSQYIDCVPGLSDLTHVLTTRDVE